MSKEFPSYTPPEANDGRNSTVDSNNPFYTPDSEGDIDYGTYDISDLNDALPPDPERDVYQQALTDRSFDTYLKNMEITIEELGHKVLDLGSGMTENFGREAQTHNIDVVSVSPHMRYQRVRDDRQKDLALEKELYEQPLPDSKYPPIAAKAEALPFRDNTFDTVVSNHGVPLYVPTEDLGQAFSEICRVLKDGGKAFLSPIVEEPGKSYSKEVVESVLTAANIPYTLKPVARKFGSQPEKFDHYVLTLEKPPSS